MYSNAFNGRQQAGWTAKTRLRRSGPLTKRYTFKEIRTRMRQIFLLLLLSPILCSAGDLTIASGGSGNVPADAITVKASHVVIDITAGTDEEGILKEWRVLDKFKKHMEEKAASLPSIEIARVASTYNARSKGSLFGSYDPTSSYRLRVSTPIKESESVIDAMVRLNNFIENIEVAKSLDFRVGAYALAIKDKEAYQAQMLERIAGRIEAVRLGLGAKFSPKLRDFSKEVVVQQNGEDTVALYYNYSVNYEQ